MANLHTAFATERVQLFEMCTLPNPLRDALMVTQLQTSSGRTVRPESAGLGVALTPEIEEQFAFRPDGGHVIQ